MPEKWKKVLKINNNNNKKTIKAMKKRLLPLAALAFAFVACDKNNDDLGIDNTKDTPITILSAGVAELTTRAIINGQLEGSLEERVAMSVWVEGSAEKYNANNVKWVHDGGNWNTNSTVLYEGENKQKICALSPYVDGASAEGVTITADGVTDYLVASQTLITSNPVNICMSHALVKLVLNPTLGTEVTGDNIATVEVQNMYASGALNVKTNSWSNQGEATATLTMTNNEALVIPMEECESFPIVVTMNSGRVFKATISLDNVASELAAGTQYTITLRVGQDTVIIGGITADSWGTPISGGNLETK